MVNGAPGSAWSSLRGGVGGQAEERMLRGTPALDDDTPLRADHLFDLASLTKVFTTVAALRLVDAGRVDLDAPVAQTVEVGRGPGAAAITLRHLLTHTAGLPAECPLWRTGLVGEALWAGVLQSELVGPPGSAHSYSDVGFIAVGELLENITGDPLEALIGAVADSLGARTLTWRPDAMLAVASETQPGRGPIRGEVHDELAAALGRPAGHAGLFGTVDDVAALARMIRDDGMGCSARVLSEESVRAMATPAVRADAGYGQTLGLRVRDTDWMGEVEAVGHTGFTGTCFAVHRDSGGFGVLLVNRVHPSRIGADISEIRRDFLAPLARG